MTETRIRWEEGSHAEHVAATFLGSAGTLDGAQFRIYEPDDRDREWILVSLLPGQHHFRHYGSDPDELKAEAERWLEEFVTSLGAVFEDDEISDDEVIFDERPTGEAFEALYAPGRRVRFEHPDGGWEGDQQMAAVLLTVGEVYTIAWSDVGFSKTRLGLSGIEDRGQGFNSVLFEPADETETPAPVAGERE